jgi:hypothetical protein
LSRLKLARITELVSAIPQATVEKYWDYWKTLEVKSDRDYYHRWIFAYTSVQRHWRQNVILFEKVKALPDGFSFDRLSRMLRTAHAGLYKVTTRGIWQFHHDFWNNPADWYPRPYETFAECRARLMKRTHGLKIAKVAFALELAFPETCEVMCADRHMLRLFGHKGDGISNSEYCRVEQHWVDCCKRRGLPSAMVRHVCWDQIQHQVDTSYWSHVFEEGT